MKVIKVRENGVGQAPNSTRKVVHEVDVTGKSERQIDKIVDGMMINLNHDKYWIDDTCEEEPERERVDKMTKQNPKCPKCGSPSMKNGKSPGGRQKYICTGLEEHQWREPRKQEEKNAR